MGTVNENFTVLQERNFYTGDFERRDGPQRCYDWYEWRDYYKDNIDGDGLSRYQLWEKSDPGDWKRNGEYNPDEMVADLEKLRRDYKAEQDRRDAAERKQRLKEQEARAAGRAAWGRRAAMGGFSNMSTDVDVSVLLGRLNQLTSITV